MKFFFDTEFRENGMIIDLISIGIVAEDGREYYAISTEFNQDKAREHDFIRENVLPLLDAPFKDWKSPWLIAREIEEFVGCEPEFWADYAAYDWIALCQLYGTMMDLPKGWPMFCRDIQQLRDWIPFDSDEIPNPKPHHALFDARECRDRYLLMESISSVDVTICKRRG